MIRHVWGLIVILIATAAIAAPATTSTTAPTDKPLDLAGLWLTDLGLMELDQTGNEVKGHYAQGGVSDIDGTIKGRRVEFRFKFQSIARGKGTFDIAPNGKTFTGEAKTNGYEKGFPWRGRRAPEFVRDVKLVAGKIVDGSTRGLLTYSIRAPEGYKEGDAKKWPAIVVLHGSNMSGKAYVNTIAATWPDIAKDYILIGINGERPSNLGGAGEEPAFNFTYVDYVGRSTYKGFPGTDRESPALVAEAMEEMRAVYPVARYFVGGHSQGAFLTYSLLMNFPERIAGAFPISGGVIFQCEPKAYEDEALKTAQRAVPLVIIHGKQDKIVDFKMGDYAAKIFKEANWKSFKFLADDSGAGHRLGLLPVRQAIRWLEKQSAPTSAPTTRPGRQ